MFYSILNRGEKERYEYNQKRHSNVVDGVFKLWFHIFCKTTMRTVLKPQEIFCNQFIFPTYLAVFLV